ncbi:MAG: hypothetical protein F6K58_23860 [Symploca sp. SIO2E9]|nr:hypothetical protein [Symploca sp. SIO2E9]
MLVTQPPAILDNWYRFIFALCTSLYPLATKKLVFELHNDYSGLTSPAYAEKLIF